MGGRVSDLLGLPKPQNDAEELAYTVIRGGSEAIFTVWGAGVLLTYRAATAAPGVVWGVLDALRAGPGSQVASGAAAEAAAYVAQKSGAGMLVGIIADLLGGAGGGKIAAGMAARGTKAVTRAERAADALEEAARGGKASSLFSKADSIAPAIKTTNHESGVTGTPKANRAIMESNDWHKAKSGEVTAAQRIVDQLWTPRQTEQLRAKLDQGKECVFLSVPSTTRLNKIPDALGERLARELGGSYIDVRTLYKMEVAEAMKDIPKLDRPFASRVYSILDKEALEVLRGKQVILTEDVLTTGSSARQFAQELRKQGVEVQTVAGLMGSGRLDAPPQLVDKLQRTLRNATIPVKGRELADVLSAGEIEAIIERINMTGGAHERAELAKRIQRLLDSRAAGLVEKHTR